MFPDVTILEGLGVFDRSKSWSWLWLFFFTQVHSFLFSNSKESLNHTTLWRYRAVGTAKTIYLSLIQFRFITHVFRTLWWSWFKRTPVKIKCENGLTHKIVWTIKSFSNYFFSLFFNASIFYRSFKIWAKIHLEAS